MNENKCDRSTPHISDLTNYWIINPMKKLKSLFLKLKSKRTIKTYQRPLLITIINFLLISLAVIVVASILGMVLDPAYFHDNFFKALAHFLSCMLTANTITKLLDVIDGHLNIVLLSVVVIAAELVLFSGAVIATLTAAVKAYIYKKSNAKGKIILEDHFVILNWSSKVPELVYNLMLKGHTGNVVIMSDKDKDYVFNEIDSLLSIYEAHKSKRKLDLIVKVGNPLLHGDLNDISIDKASNIVIVSREDMEEGDNPGITTNDLLSLKIMLVLGNFDISPDCNIVIETDKHETAKRIESLAATLTNFKEKSVIPVSFNRKLGQIIANTIFEPRIADVYMDLFSFDGNEFYSCDTSDSVEEYLLKHDEAIPIIRFDYMFTLANDKSGCSHTRSAAIAPDSVRILPVKKTNRSTTCDVFIIGNNKKGVFIRENLNIAAVTTESSFRTHYYDEIEIAKLIKDVKNTDGIKKVLILSNDRVSVHSYDANVFMSLIAFQNAFGQSHDDTLSFITELLDSKNYNCIKDFDVKNAIISNRMMSLLLTQLALNRDSKKFFEGLLRADTEEGGDEFDIRISKVEDMFENTEDLSFGSYGELVRSFYFSFDKKDMLLGYMRKGETIFFAKGQDTPRQLRLASDDELIYIHY